ncbi:thiamine pyrophosphate-binding protein [Pararobbsia alpina]|uniref:Acetolactate synthase isozyme 2 large subunit n=1 Tax=Pararobbsia alpina TaxID=621374 RepID=A0A6S7B8W3_9BURK|nr:thiamine pyrophosphate-binding protein [Pararobbsia alpina]CAB3792130.1 Acetolactate synthase isozyme 2 large subunit [Pararobbsia alpina]
MTDDSQMQTRHGGRVLVDALSHNGVDTVYCVPGESYLPVLDALYDAPGIQTIVTRHEGAAANMADAYGKLTGRPGICFVTRGPGATHASIGVHTARQDSTPMILFVGQVETKFMGREAFQELDYRQVFGTLAKWVTEIETFSRIPEIVARAFAVATSGRPGPIVVALPEDVLFASGKVADAGTAQPVSGSPGEASLQSLRALLARAQRPLLIVGGTGWDAQARASLADFVRLNDLPVAASFRRQDLFDNDDEHYAGQIGIGISPALAQTVKSADLLIVLGSRLGEVPSGGYELVRSPVPVQTLVHIHPDPQELGRVYQAGLPINAGVASTARALAQLAPVASAAWKTWRADVRQAYLEHSTPLTRAEDAACVDLAQVVLYLRETLPPDAIIANGAGNYTVWVHRFYRYRHPATQLAPTSGAMGYGFPAAIAAKLRYPRRTVVCFAGDGCFMMYPQELATAMQYGAAVIVIVVNNGMLGTIRMHQEREYPGRISATGLRNPDFVAFAKSFGAYGERVERTEAFPAAFERAQQAGVAALIELRTDPRQITPALRLNSTDE